MDHHGRVARMIRRVEKAALRMFGVLQGKDLSIDPC